MNFLDFLDCLLTEENIFHYFTNIFPFYLTITSAVILIFSLYPITKLILALKNGKIKNNWITLRILIVLFIILYLVYSLQYIIDTIHIREYLNHPLLIPILLFFGSIFVLVVGFLALKTTKNIKDFQILKEESITDFLLNIYNRRFFNKILNELIDKSRKNKDFKLSLFLIDIDDFKSINDIHGHLIGDLALKNISNILKEQTTQNEILCRYGGDEIVVICPNKTKEERKIIAENIRSFLDNNNLIEEGINHPEIKKTISVGLVSVENINCVDIECFLDKADSNLYKAKQKGKNQICC